MNPERNRRTLSRCLRSAAAAAILLALAACSGQQARSGSHEALHATLWVQSAAEYAASARQAYRLAGANLDLALADSRWTAALEQGTDYSHLPPAILLDIDQTVLDTGSYNARIVKRYGLYTPAQFAQWCQEVTAPAIPGAKAFIEHAIERGVTVIYYSRRSESLRDCTTRNLAALGIPLADPKHLSLRQDANAITKAQKRTELAPGFRILLIVGDDLDDFVHGAKSEPQARRALARQHAERWGREWIILPNPMYGSWEASLYNFDYSRPRDERLDLKLQALEE